MFKYNSDLSFDDNTIHGILATYIEKGDTVLEFGCARGKFSEYIKNNLGCRVYGIEISEEALKDASPHLEKQICCDIENYNWEKELEGVYFDTLVFADVLEHLKEPEKAISRALSLLKPEGKIVFSVPNVAHADIIMKLLNNRFDYTETGLLDSTHIHLFGKENLTELCDKSGIFPVLIKGTVASFGTTEQAMESDNLLYKNAVLLNDELLVYHYFCLAHKKAYAKALGAVTIYDIPQSPRNEVKIYFDTGHSFSEETKLSYFFKDGEMKINADIPQNTTAFRIDLREDGGYIVRKLKTLVDGRSVEPSVLIRTAKMGEDYVLFDKDPQFIFRVPKNTKKLSVSAEIQNFFSLENPVKLAVDMTSKSTELSSKFEKAKHDLELKKKELNALKAESRTTEIRLKSEIKNLSLEKEEALTSVSSLEATLGLRNQEIDALDKRNKTLDAKIKNERKENMILDSHLQSVSADLEHYKLHYFAAINQREELKKELSILQEKYDVIRKAELWLVTKPIRVILDIIKWPFKNLPFFRLIGKFFGNVKDYGLIATFKKLSKKQKDGKRALAPLYTKKELEDQRLVKFDRKITFSILVPLYNTPEKFLCEMIDSVIAQTYENWELCLADGSDDKHKNVGVICKRYAKNDQRIKYQKLEKNLGISGNTNACIDMATGDFISLFDHDDLLHPAALFNVMEAICTQDADFIYTDENTFRKTPKDAYCPHFKPDYAPDTLRTNNYICHFTSFDRSLIDKVGKFRSCCDGSQDYDMVLRLTEQAKKIVHIPKILYWWRAHAGSVATDIGAKPYVIDAAHRALKDHLERVGLKGQVENTVVPSIYKIKYDIIGEPLVSIIIANKDHKDDLKKCIDSVLIKSTYKNYEIIIVENNSTEKETFEYYQELESRFTAKVVTWTSPEGKFNYSAINNLGVKEASGDYVILLNNDTEVISPDWIQEMLMFAQRPDIGAVGAKLYYPDNTIQHAGVGIGLLTLAGHYFKNFHKNDPGYMGRLIYAHNVSAVTAACVMLPRKVWDEINGLDESFEVAFNDIDMCMRIRQKGYLIVFTPFCELYHYESKSRGLDSAPEKRERFVGEVRRFQERWAKELEAGDPYYNPNFTLDKEDFSIR